MHLHPPLKSHETLYTIVPSFCSSIDMPLKYDLILLHNLLGLVFFKPFQASFNIIKM